MTLIETGWYSVFQAQEVKLKTTLTTIVFALILSSTLPAPTYSQSDLESQIRALKWQNGPITATTVGDATIFIPPKYGFLDGSETRKFDTLLQNIPDDHVTNTIVPDSFIWQAYLSFSEVGYVKDDDHIDADALLQSIKEGTETANIERKKNGWPQLHVVGWKYPPHYDDQNKRLVWATEVQTEGSGKVINYNERILGRKGVTSATLVAAPEDLDAAVKEFEAVIAGYQFSSGNTYAEFKQGDHVAEYGLAALILGGGAAAVAKSGGGFFKVIFFAIAAGFAAVVGIFRKFFGKASSK